jgi:hypothetical protein
MTAPMEAEAVVFSVRRESFGRALEKVRNKVPVKLFLLRASTHLGALTTAARCHGTVL